MKQLRLFSRFDFCFADGARRAVFIWCVLCVCAVGVFVAALMLGSVTLTPAQALSALWHVGGPSSSVDVSSEIVTTLRMPRALAGFACGALLALAGVLLQVLLRNPLAEPYVLGVSGGASAFAVFALMMGCAWWMVQAASFAGALCSILLVLSLTHRDLSRGEPQDASARLLLTGVVIAMGWFACVTLFVSLAPDNQLRSIYFWFMGDLSGAGMPWFALLALACAFVVAVPCAPQLNALLHGEASAHTLGVPVGPVRLRIYLVASLAAAAAVSTGGTIGFIGLVAPHALRLACGNDQRMLVIASPLAGGVVVMAADLIARTVIAPAQLPVGVVTALIGAPVFLWMLLSRHPSRCHDYDNKIRNPYQNISFNEEGKNNQDNEINDSVNDGRHLSVAVRRVTLRVGARTLLNDFTQVFGPGEMWCIVGPNGAGKTTFLSTLGGLLQPAAGEIEVDGVALATWPLTQLARRRALMPQRAQDAFSSRVFDTVLLHRFAHLSAWGWEQEKDREAAYAALDALALLPLAQRDVLTLSGGERQRVALAAALCQQTPLLLLDEPLAHLDLHHQIDCLDMLVHWVAQASRTVIFSCHDLNLARRFATHALLIDGSGVAHAGAAHEVLTSARVSRAFDCPLVLIEQHGYEALAPVSQPTKRRKQGARRSGF